MSVGNRKIGLYSFELVNETNAKLEGDKMIKYFDFLINFINTKDYSIKICEIPETKKFYFLSECTPNEAKKNMIFKSAKIGHRPPLIKKETGNERENPKLIDEGESEKSHLVTKYSNDEIIVALEERKVGVTISQIVKYFNNYINQLPIETDYFRNLNINTHYFINLNIIPYEGFLEHLGDFSRIIIGTIEIDKQYLGSEYLNLANLGETVRENITITFKASRGESILKEMIRELYSKFTGSNRKIERIRIQGITSEDTKIQLDTNSLKKLERVDVDLDEITGLVRSNQMFQKLNAIVQNL